jgi:hypothetical protein|tara:strand:- start:236 stop:472 length:237 start_codon:yes stop_codon:yes gene_type:complete
VAWEVALDLYWWSGGSYKNSCETMSLMVCALVVSNVNIHRRLVFRSFHFDHIEGWEVLVFGKFDVGGFPSVVGAISVE